MNKEYDIELCIMHFYMKYGYMKGMCGSGWKSENSEVWSEKQEKKGVLCVMTRKQVNMTVEI
jgi:hypothetical protein